MPRSGPPTPDFWQNMEAGIDQPDFSSIGSNDSVQSGLLSSNGSLPQGLPETRMSSGAVDQLLREEEYNLQLEHERGIRVCYTGDFLTGGTGNKHSNATYTIKEFLELATNKFNKPGPEPMPQPEYDSEYRTQKDLDNLLEYFHKDGNNNIVTSLCSTKQHGDPALGFPSCKECEDYAKDNAGPDLYTAQAREDARARDSRRRRRESRRRRERESIRRTRLSADRGRSGARVELIEKLKERTLRRKRRRERRAARREGRRSTRRQSRRQSSSRGQSRRQSRRQSRSRGQSSSGRMSSTRRRLAF